MTWQQFRSRLPVGWLWLLALISVSGLAWLTAHAWWPVARGWVQQTIQQRKPGPALDEPGYESDQHAHGGHIHAHDEATSLELSPQAMGNVGLTAEYLKPIQLENFQRTITVPAIIVERPGRTRLEVSTPMAGVITHVHAVQGEAVDVGTLLFELRITAEELVATQTALLKTIGELNVEQREIARLEEITKSGAIPQKTLLERQYARDKLEVVLAAQKEALRLQGLSERQVEEMVEKRRLLRDLQIVAPAPDEHRHEELRLTGREIRSISFQGQGKESAPADADEKEEPGNDHSSTPLILQDVLVHKGERVASGTTLAVVSDMSELYIEGRAFEQDIDLLAAAAAHHWKVTAVFERAGQQVDVVPDLELLYSASNVDVETRILKFYVRLPNEISREVPSPNGLKYLEWKYRPGQRLLVRVPVEEWKDQIVLPVEAISQEGAESFVFQQNGSHFDRIPVRVLYRDQAQAVIRNDGSIFPGDVIARRGAHQMQMALKNKSGAGADPHAGHSH